MNKDIEHIEHMNRLLNSYGKLLTSIQLDIMRDYFEFNLSFQEIAENRNISRSAVSDCVLVTSKKLENFEANLGLIEFIEKQKAKNDPKINEIIEELEERLSDGI